MRIKELHLKNFRGFKELEIKFPDSNLVVFVGINGAGKSSILDCIAMFLSQFVTELCKKSSRDTEFAITENDINIDNIDFFEKCLPLYSGKMYKSEFVLRLKSKICQ